MLAHIAEQDQVEKTFAMVQNISQRVYDMPVRMTQGPYSGRTAHLQGAIIGHDGRIHYLCMVERADGSGVPLNGDAASRSYLPDDWFTLIEELS